MEENLFKSTSSDDFLKFNKAQLSHFFETQKLYHLKLQQENNDLKKQIDELKDKILFIEGQLIILRTKLFKRKSEKSLPTKNPGSKPRNKKNKQRKKTHLLPSERYPDAAIYETHVELKDLPKCSCCAATMEDSGMTENSEYLSVVPKEYFIVRQLRHKYRCGKCHGDIKTAPNPPRIIPGSSYSDEMIIDIAMSKFCDLIPVERYAMMAGREGLIDLPPNSLIGTTHKLAEFIEPAVNKIREEILSSLILNADETPHRMLEGDEEKKSWYLWGFSNNESSYFEIRNTRSGDVASELLTKSQCQYLVSDVFSGYKKSVKESNKLRKNHDLPLIVSVYCNAHSRRKFKEAAEKFPKEAVYYIDAYKDIYKLEKEGKEESSLLADKRAAMKKIFEGMKKTAEKQKESFSSKSLIVTAINYFLNNYTGLTRFLENTSLPIDNNHQERQLRNPVIGRKTWYGTHSKQGAKTTAIYFTLVESCKLNKINPRAYLQKLVQSLNAGQKAFSPKEFKENLGNTS